MGFVGFGCSDASLGGCADVDESLEEVLGDDFGVGSFVEVVFFLLFSLESSWYLLCALFITILLSFLNIIESGSR